MILVDNIVTLKKRFPECWEIVKAAEEKQSEDLQIEATRAGVFTLSLATNSGRMYLHSKYDPMTEAEKVLGKFPEIQKYKHVFFYGVGLGYHVEMFSVRYPNTAFSVYEPNISIFNVLLANQKLQKLKRIESKVDK